MRHWKYRNFKKGNQTRSVILRHRKMSWEGSYCLQRAVWRNGGCGSLESVTKQQVTWLVASVGSPQLRQAATTLGASGGQSSAQGTRNETVRRRNLTNRKVNF